MKIFISHSLDDQNLIREFKNTLEPHNVTLLIAEHYNNLENTITEKIENMIRECDVALILLTKNGYESHFVQQEIGYIKSQQIPFLQLVQLGYENKIKGFNYGKEYVQLDPEQPDLAIEKVKLLFLDYWQKKNEEIQKETVRLQNIELIKKINAQKRKEEATAKLVLGGLASVLLISLLND